jgi:hypothetical protein
VSIGETQAGGCRSADIDRCAGILCTRVRTAAIAAVLLALQCVSASAVNVTTHHYDNLRTGWNQAESVLSPASVANGSFGILATAAFDAQVDAQPLLVRGLSIAGQGTHDVVFIETENNSVYALDATSGALLLQTNLGPSVPPSNDPRHAQLGIQSAPVIDPAAGMMYLITATLENGAVTYRVHAINLTTLADATPSTIVSAVGMLDDGTQVVFNPIIQRQRPALVEANGNVYAAFGSFGDGPDLLSRGWLLGWDAASLSPLASNVLTNHRASANGCSPTHLKPCLLSSIWMSGSGIAADSAGNLYAVTGNSQDGTFDGTDNIQETVLKLSPDISQILGEFTPWNVDDLDAKDLDLASGGIMLLPEQKFAAPHLAVAAGKGGTLYLLDRDNLGGHVTAPPDRVLGSYSIGRCWCTESYFTGSDGVGRIVSSGGVNAVIWQIVQRSWGASLKRENSSATLATGQDPGFFTTVSSNGTTAGSAVIWAVARPQTQAGTLTLYAFDASSASTILSIDAGTFPNTDFNANVMPVVANGLVYVAGGSHLTILGLNAQNRAAVFKGVDTASPPPVSGHRIYGTINRIDGTRIRLKLRTGNFVTVDAAQAIANDDVDRRAPGEALGVEGVYDKDRVFKAAAIFRAKPSPAVWLPDR